MLFMVLWVASAAGLCVWTAIYFILRVDQFADPRTSYDLSRKIYDWKKEKDEQ